MPKSVHGALHAARAFPHYMRVDLGSADVGMSHQLLTVRIS